MYKALMIIKKAFVSSDGRLFVFQRIGYGFIFCLKKEKLEVD